MRLVLAVEVPDERVAELTNSTRVPKEFLAPDAVQITWGYRDPNAPWPGPVQSTGYVTWHREGVELRVVPNEFVEATARRVFELLAPLSRMSDEEADFVALRVARWLEQRREDERIANP